MLEYENKKRIASKIGAADAAAGGYHGTGQENTAQRTGGSRARKRSKAPLIVIGLLLAAALGAYGGLCAYAVNRPEIWEDTVVLGQDLGGLIVEDAAARLENTLPAAQIQIYLYPDGEYPPEERPETPDATVAVADLDIQADLAQAAREAYEYPLSGANWWEAGWRYLTYQGVFYGISASMAVDGERAAETAMSLAEALSYAPVDAAYEVAEDELSIQTARDGRAVSSAVLEQALSAPYWDMDLTLNIPYITRPAETLTAQEIHDACAGEAKNATYDAETDALSPSRSARSSTRRPPRRPWTRRSPAPWSPSPPRPSCPPSPPRTWRPCCSGISWASAPPGWGAPPPAGPT